MSSLYIKHRPTHLGGMVGADDIKSAMVTALENNAIPHTILLSGPSGCGKTTVARCISKLLNCADMDFIEVNCADQSGVENVRAILNTSRKACFGGGSRVILFDEAHKLSSSAQNGLLKDIEEPAKHVYYIFVTTEPEKIIKTVRNRCMGFKLNPLSNTQMGVLLDRVARIEGIQLDSMVRSSIVENSDGSSRKALVLLEKVLYIEDPIQARKAIILSLDDDLPDVKSIAQTLCNPSMDTFSRWKVIKGHLAKFKQTANPDLIAAKIGLEGYLNAVLLNTGDRKHASVLFLQLEGFICYTDYTIRWPVFCYLVGLACFQWDNKNVK